MGRASGLHMVVPNPPGEKGLGQIGIFTSTKLVSMQRQEPPSLTGRCWCPFQFWELQFFGGIWGFQTNVDHSGYCNRNHGAFGNETSGHHFSCIVRGCSTEHLPCSVRPVECARLERTPPPIVSTSTGANTRHSPALVRSIINRAWAHTICGPRRSFLASTRYGWLHILHITRAAGVVAEEVDSCIWPCMWAYYGCHVHSLRRKFFDARGIGRQNEAIFFILRCGA